MSPIDLPRLTIQDLPYTHLRTLYKRPQDFSNSPLELQNMIRSISSNFHTLHADLLPNPIKESILQIVVLVLKTAPKDQQTAVLSITDRNPALDTEEVVPEDREAKIFNLLEHMEKYTAFQNDLRIWARKNLDKIKAKTRILDFLGDLSTREIDSSSLKLTSIPSLPDCTGFRLLEVLNISDNQLKHFPHKQLLGLNRLRRLNFSRNKLSSFPREGLESLEEADFSENQIKSMRKHVKGFKRLQRLTLAKNKITYFPRNIKGLECLKKGDFSDNEISDFPEKARGLASVEELNFSGNKIQFFPSGLKYFIHLKDLDLSRNQITYLTERIKVPKSLENLNLSQNGICLIDAEIEGLQWLKNLDLSWNDLLFFPKIGFRQLDSVDLSHNMTFTSVKAIFERERVKKIVFFGNDVKLLPVDEDETGPETKRPQIQE